MRKGWGRTAGIALSSGLPKEDSESQPKRIWLLILERVWEAELGHEQGEEHTLGTCLKGRSM